MDVVSGEATTHRFKTTDPDSHSLYSRGSYVLMTHQCGQELKPALDSDGTTLHKHHVLPQHSSLSGPVGSPWL